MPLTLLARQASARNASLMRLKKKPVVSISSESDRTTHISSVSLKLMVELVCRLDCLLSMWTLNILSSVALMLSSARVVRS
eukprot:6189534-Pleurochrysis_carterae.AAC.6